MTDPSKPALYDEIDTADVIGKPDELTIDTPDGLSIHIIPVGDLWWNLICPTMDGGSLKFERVADWEVPLIIAEVYQVTDKGFGMWVREMLARAREIFSTPRKAA